MLCKETRVFFGGVALPRTRRAASPRSRRPAMRVRLTGAEFSNGTSPIKKHGRKTESRRHMGRRGPAWHDMSRLELRQLTHIHQ